MKEYKGVVADNEYTCFGYTLSIINGKWKLLIIFYLSTHGTVRYNELQRMIGKITYRTLSTTLKEMESDDLIHREEYPQIPPKVEYSLNEKGKSLWPIIKKMCQWGEINKENKIMMGDKKDIYFVYTLSIINGKWKLLIIFYLSRHGTVRYNELQRMIGRITYKTLSTTLKEMESDGLIHREEYPQIPPKVEYSLTEKGKTLWPIIQEMCQWGEKNKILN